MMTLLFWLVAGALFVAVAGYGLAVIALARLLPTRGRSRARPVDATLLIAAHNEEDCIGAKLANALAQDVAPHRLSIRVVSDGSTDGTARRVRQCDDPRVALTEIPRHVGKIAAMSRALEQVGGDVVIFSDANSRFVPGALKALLDHFGDPAIGGVCGAPAIARRRSGWLGWAEALYWRYDNALKRAEGRLGGVVSAQGSLYAVRRALLGPIPLSVADDFFISTEVVAKGRRLAFEPAAVTIETVSNDTRGEFRRRVRSTERGWRGLLARRALLNPFRHGAYAVQLFCHKVLRRMVPLLLVALLVLSVPLAPRHGVYAAALAGQVAFYAWALLALLPSLRRLPGAAPAFFFLETQVAMAMGLTRVALGRHSSRWSPVRNAAVAGDPPGQ